MRSQQMQSVTSEVVTMNQESVAIAEQLPKYILSACLGGLGGLMGVTLVIGAIVMDVLIQSPTTTYSPSIALLLLLAVPVGWGVSWLLNQAASRMLPHLFSTDDRHLLLTLFSFSFLMGLIEILVIG